MEKINIGGILYDSVVDGPGLRTVVFFQGCPHGCIGCHNPDSWVFEEKTLYNVKDLVNEVINKSSEKKVTISGGEPFSQKEVLLDLVKLLKNEEFHICVYTGYLYEELKSDEVANDVLNNIDILIDGKFELDKIDHSNSFIGSTNQRIIKLNQKK